MFEENDRWYYSAKVRLTVWFIVILVLAGLSVLAGLIVAIHFSMGWIFLVGLATGGLILVVALNVRFYGNLSLSKMYDVKIIRDKICKIAQQSSSQVETRKTSQASSQPSATVVVKKPVSTQQKSIAISGMIIKPSAFLGRSDIEIVRIEDSVFEIHKHAFMKCTSLKKVYIGKGVKRIEEYAFGSCLSIEKIVYNGTKKDWEQINISQFGNEVLSRVPIEFVK